MFGSEGKAETKVKFLSVSVYVFGPNYQISDKEILMDIFKTAEKLPRVIFYDNNCQLLQHIRNNVIDRAFFKNIVMPVSCFKLS